MSDPSPPETDTQETAAPAPAAPAPAAPGRARTGAVLRRPWLAVAAVALLALALVSWHGSRPLGTAGASSDGRPDGIAVAPVTRSPVERTLALVGTIEPGGIVNVTAPFDGTVEERPVDFGMRVERDQVMLVLDSSGVELELREAEVAVIRARQAVEELESWEDGAEVARARNAVLSARLTLEELTRKERESRALLDGGIIPRNEYEGVVSERQAQELQLSVARQELDAVLSKGDERHRRVAELELENATERLEAVRRRVAAGAVTAPVAGLVLRPTPASGGDDGTTVDVQVGSRLTAGQPLFTVAHTETLRIRARVHEMDVNRIRIGQPVAVTGDAFGAVPLPGSVAQIAAQAASGGSATPGDAVFEVVVAVDAIPPALRDRIRVGMSATLSIVTYRNADALVAPAGAVRTGPDGPFVLRHDPATGDRAPVPVTVGEPTPGGVEILAGIEPGDSVVVDGTAAGAGAPPGGAAPATASATLGPVGERLGPD